MPGVHSIKNSPFRRLGEIHSAVPRGPNAGDFLFRRGLAEPAAHTPLAVRRHPGKVPRMPARRRDPATPHLLPTPENRGPGDQTRFIDLFCGIGGFRLAFEQAGARCVFSSDWDKYSQQTYAANFGERPHGDLRIVADTDVPAHDILCGGFPCQPFSLAGVSKKNSLGRAHGFDDERQGNLFFEIARLLHHHRPAAFVLGFTMVVAAFDVLGSAPWFMGPGVAAAKEPALLYLIPMIAIILSGAGAYSLDAGLYKEGKRRRW